eukprot:TRINITY_DN9307_c0_g1_i1.p1 TRINITY_DN9307_c0_g1~~TRINITY_DN9307_c0_g1_i1.p1  ORF type:complete len:1313 (+),score=287.49 TRINITY_DN9307_c0_g1_i1:212-3940(+)
MAGGHELVVRDIHWAMSQLAHAVDDDEAPLATFDVTARLLPCEPQQASYCLFAIRCHGPFAICGRHLCPKRLLPAMRIVLTTLNRWIALVEDDLSADLCHLARQFTSHQTAVVTSPQVVKMASRLVDPTDNCNTLQDVYDLSQREDAMTQLDPLAKLRQQPEQSANDAQPSSLVDPIHHTSQSPDFSRLPAEVIQKIAQHLNARDVSAFRCTCKTIYQASLYVVPGLTASLFQHQKAALNWMRHREAGGSNGYLHPRFQSIPACAIVGKEQHGNKPVLFLDTDTGELQQSGDLRHSSLGGLLCDDPGLGKTVSMLALILSSHWPRDCSGQRLDSDRLRIANLSKLFSSWPEFERRQFRLGLYKDFFGCICEEAASFGVDPHVFSDPVDAEEVPDYATVIARPICLEEVRSREYTSLESMCEDFELVLHNAITYNGADHPLGLLAQRLLTRFEPLVLARTKPANKTVSRRARNASKPMYNATLIIAPTVDLAKHWEQQLYEHTKRDAVKVFRLTQASRLPDNFDGYDVVITTMNVVGSVQTKETHYDLFHARRWYRVVLDEGHNMGKGSRTNARQAVQVLLTERLWVVSGTPTPEMLSSSGLKYIKKLMEIVKEPPFSEPNTRNMFMSLMLYPFERHLATDAIWRLVIMLKRVMIRHSKREAMKGVPLPICEVVLLSQQAAEKRSYNSVLSFIRANIVLTTMKGNEESAKQDSVLESPKELRNAMTNMRVLCTGKWTFTLLIDQNAVEETLAMMESFAIETARIQDFNNYVQELRADKREFPCRKCGIFVLALIVLPCCGRLTCYECIGEEKCPFGCDNFDIDDMQRLQPGLFLDNIAIDNSLGDIHELGHLRECTESYASALADARRKSSAVQDWALLDMRQNRSLVQGRGQQLNGENGTPASATSMDTAPAPAPAVATTSLAAEPREPTPLEAENALINNSKTAHLALELSHLLMPLEEELKRRVRWDHSTMLVNQPSNKNSQAAKAAVKPKRARFADDVVDTTAPNVSEDRSEVVEQMLEMTAQDDKLPPRDRWKWMTKVLKSKEPTFKAIIYSSSRQVLQDVQFRLDGYYGEKAVAAYYSNQKDSNDITRFRNNTSCIFLLLSTEGAVGLDLHFVTNIFILEEPIDKSLEAQVIARAWRIGCKHQVRVQKLIMSGTVEEMLWRINSGQETGHVQDLEDEQEEDEAIESTQASRTASRRQSAASNRRQSRSNQRKALSVDLVKSRYILKTIGLVRESAPS